MKISCILAQEEDGVEKVLGRTDMDAHRKTMLLFIALAIVMTACRTGVQAGCCCPALWTAFGQHCYRFFSYEKTWQQAEDYCQSFSVPSLGVGEAFIDSLGHLVSIHSEAENNFVTTLFRSSHKKESADSAMWLGLHDISIEGDFEWTDGTSFNFSLWRNGQPNNLGSGEDCAQIRAQYGYKWNDDNCYANWPYFVCKLPSW